MQVKERLMKILSFWADRGVFNPTEMATFEQAMFSGNTALDAKVSTASFRKVLIEQFMILCCLSVANWRLPG